MRPVLLTIACLACVSPSEAELLAHYTFDSEDVMGSTIVDLAGGDHNATRVGFVGFGVEGILGEAVRLPNDDGVSYLRLPAADNPAPNGNDARTIAYWFSQDLVGLENKMFGYGSGASGQSFDFSLEGGGVRLRYSGGNVTWGSGFDFTGSDAGFHHLAIRVPDNAVDYLDIDVFLDGLPLVGVPTAGNPGSTPINTGGGLATELNIGRSPVFDPAGDYIGLIDDFRIYGSALSDAEIRDLAGTVDALVLEVDPITGAVAIINPSDEPISLDYYEIASSSGSLSASDWVPLQTQDRADFPAGGGTGDGWETLGPATDAQVVEGRLIGSSVVEADGWVGLGNLAGGDPGDLTFVYRDGEAFRTGRVTLADAGIEGDYNRDGLINAVDYALWRDREGSSIVLPTDSTPGTVNGTDYLAWQSHYGTGPALAIPEPSTLSVVVVGLIVAGRRLRPAKNGADRAPNRR